MYKNRLIKGPVNQEFSYESLQGSKWGDSVYLTSSICVRLLSQSSHLINRGIVLKTTVRKDVYKMELCTHIKNIHQFSSKDKDSWIPGLSRPKGHHYYTNNKVTVVEVRVTRGLDPIKGESLHLLRKVREVDDDIEFLCVLRASVVSTRFLYHPFYLNYR